MRERVRPFYQAYVDGKFRKAYDIVADSSKDDFLTASKPHYDGFQILKIAFSDDRTKATVTTEIHTTMLFWGRVVPEKTTEDTHWEMVDGQWYWYRPGGEPGRPSYNPAQQMLMGMFHMTPPGQNSPAGTPGGTAPGASAPPNTSATQAMSPGIPFGMPMGFPPGMGPAQGQASLGPGAPVPPSPAAMAALLQQLRNQVKLDTDKVELQADHAGKAAVTATNTMPGAVQVSVSCPQTDGLTVEPGTDQLRGNDSMKIAIAWNPPGSRAVPGPVSCQVSVMPTSTVLPFTITFR